jgi:high frequency lysogenization protein
MTRAIALAGVLQAADLVAAIAQRGQAEPEDVDTCLASLLKIDAPSSAEIYGGSARLHSGLRLLEQQLGNPRIWS